MERKSVASVVAVQTDPPIPADLLRPDRIALARHRSDGGGWGALVLDRLSQGLRPEGCQTEAMNPDIFPARKSSNHVLDPYFQKAADGLLKNGQHRVGLEITIDYIASIAYTVLQNNGGES